MGVGPRNRAEADSQLRMSRIRTAIQQELQAELREELAFIQGERVTPEIQRRAEAATEQVFQRVHERVMNAVEGMFRERS